MLVYVQTSLPWYLPSLYKKKNVKVFLAYTVTLKTPLDYFHTWQKALGKRGVTSESSVMHTEVQRTLWSPRTVYYHYYYDNSSDSRVGCVQV